MWRPFLDQLDIFKVALDGSVIGTWKPSVSRRGPTTIPAYPGAGFDSTAGNGNNASATSSAGYEYTASFANIIDGTSSEAYVAAGPGSIGRPSFTASYNIAYPSVYATGAADTIEQASPVTMCGPNIPIEATSGRPEPLNRNATNANQEQTS